MTATVFRLPKATEITASALVVQPHVPHLLQILSTLTTLGFDVTVTDTFKDAKQTLANTKPLLLLTDIKLREYNGLHLVMRARSTWPGLASIVTSEVDDPMLRHEAEQMGATFLALPVSDQELAAAITRTVRRKDIENRFESIRPPFERRRSDRRLAPSAPLANDQRRSERRKPWAVALDR